VNFEDAEELALYAVIVTSGVPTSIDVGVPYNLDVEGSKESQSLVGAISVILSF
jgi:hypothetical protein